jgi:hypothetical protein
MRRLGGWLRGWLGRELGSRAQSSTVALSHTASVRGVTPPENSVTNSRADCAFTQQMIGCIKAISPCLKSTSAKLFLDLHTVRVGAEWRGERTLGAAAQVERGYALDGAAAALTVAHTRGVAMPLSWSWSHHSLRAARQRLHPRSAVL